jgi:uncharacterized protein
MRRAGLILLSAALPVLGALLAGHILSMPWNRAVPRPASRLPWEKLVLAGLGKRTACWFLKGSNGLGVILAHGNWSTRNSMIPRGAMLAALGYTVIIPDLNGHGETPGRRRTFGLEESKDVRNCEAHLRSLGTGKILAIGTSLGGAALVYAAADGMALDGAVLESVYADIRAAVENRFAFVVGPLASFLAPVLLWQIPLYLGARAEDLSVAGKVEALRCPILIIGGTRDRRTTPEDIGRIFRAAREPKRLWLVEGAGHVDLHRYAPEEYGKRIEAFFGAAAGAGA